MGNSTSTPGATAANLAVQTVFTPPASCAAAITELSASADLWNNAIVPAPTMAATSCYPSQFVSSVLATTSLPPFSQLICPSTWETYDVNSTYIICCPSNYGLYAPNISYAARPALSAICTSIIWSGVLYDVTSYNQTTPATVLGLTAGVNGTIAIATPFEGFAASTTMTATSTSNSTSTMPSSTPQPTSTPLSSTSYSSSSSLASSNSTITASGSSNSTGSGIPLSTLS